MPLVELRKTVLVSVLTALLAMPSHMLARSGCVSCPSGDSPPGCSGSKSGSSGSGSHDGRGGNGGSGGGDRGNSGSAYGNAGGSGGGEEGTVFEHVVCSVPGLCSDDDEQAEWDRLDFQRKNLELERDGLKEALRTLDAELVAIRSTSRQAFAEMSSRSAKTIEDLASYRGIASEASKRAQHDGAITEIQALAQVDLHCNFDPDVALAKIGSDQVDLEQLGLQTFKTTERSQLERLRRTQRYKDAASAQIEGSSDRESSHQLLELAQIAIDSADESYAVQEEYQGNEFLQRALAFVDLSLDFVPVAGEIKDAITLVSGINPVTGEHVGDLERSLILAAIFIPRPIAAIGKAVTRGVKTLRKVIARGGKSAAKADELVEVVTRADNELREFMQTQGAVGDAVDRLADAARNGKWSAVFNSGMKPDTLLTSPTLLSKIKADKRIPDDWIAGPTKRNNGLSLNKPGSNKADEVRIMGPSPKSPHETSHAPYVIYKRNGRWLDKDGNLLSTRKSEAAHIPVDEFIYLP